MDAGVKGDNVIVATQRFIVKIKIDCISTSAYEFECLASYSI